MRILIATDTFPPEINGVATSSYSLRSVLEKNGHQVMVITTNPYNNQTMSDFDTIRVPGAELKALYDYRLAGVYYGKAMKIIRAFKPDIVHIQTEFGIGQFAYIIAKQLRIPVVNTYHTSYEDYTYYITKGHFDALARKLVRTYIKQMFESRAVEIISPSVKTKDYIRQIGFDGHINVVPTGIDFSKFNRSNFKEEDLKAKKKELGIKDDDFVLLSLGRVAEEKSIDLCINGFKKYLDKYKDEHIKFLIVGGGPALEGLVNQAKQLGISDKVIFAGSVPNTEVAFYYNLGNAFVSASITETQGLTFMEAMAARIPVLARFDANLVGVIDDGKTGLFFIDENNMADKLYEAINMGDENTRSLCEAAFKQIDVFSIEKFYDNVIGVYNRAIKKFW